MPNFRDMLKTLASRFDEIAAGPDQQMPAPNPPARSGVSRLAPNKDAQRILPLMVGRGAVEDFVDIGMSDREANEILDRLLSGDDDTANPILLAYVSNTELNALMLMAAKVLKWTTSEAMRTGDAQTISRLKRSAEMIFDSAKRAQQNAVNGFRP